MILSPNGINKSSSNVTGTGSDQFDRLECLRKSKTEPTKCGTGSSTSHSRKCGTSTGYRMDR